MDEMNKLRRLLDERGIKWRDDSANFGELTIIRTKFRNKHGQPCSVIYGEHVSIGWFVDMLESMPPVHDYSDTDGVEGYLTADEIMQEWF